VLIEAESRSAPRPTSTADSVTGPLATWPFAPGTIVRTIGGAAATDGDGADVAPGEGAATAGLGDGWLAAGLAEG